MNKWEGYRIVARMNRDALTQLCDNLCKLNRHGRENGRSILVDLASTLRVVEENQTGWKRR